MIAEGLHVIVGLGATGLSCARFLQKHGVPFAISDTRANPPNLAALQSEFPGVELSLGKFDEELFNKASVLVVSPGLSIKEPAIEKQIANGKPVIGDIELFSHATNAPVIAITGTNAKSTVTTLVGEMAKQAGIKTAVGGNLGIPALDLLSQKDAELFVLELSSFQLETTHSLAPEVATILNVTPDHMDRYIGIEDYRLAKFRVYSDCAVAVCNRDDPSTDCGDQYSRCRLNFTLNTPRENEFGLLNISGESYLAFEDQVLLPVRELPILGRHYQANALASLAIGYGYGLPFNPMLKVLREFKGLAHRCQLVRERSGVSWYNDSKGTNVGATLAALEGLGAVIQGKLILIAGGIGKNADFSTLVPAIQKYVKAVVLIGEAANEISTVIGDRVPKRFANSMDEAVALADQLAKEKDSVLLSPACASMDMFKNFEHRGDVFVELVSKLA